MKEWVSDFSDKLLSETRRIIISMQLIDRSSTTPPAVIDGAFRIGSEPNQNTYLRLKLSLSLNLRRQVFLAICDDLALRNRLAVQLDAELAHPARFTPPSSLVSPAIAPQAIHQDKPIGTAGGEGTAKTSPPQLVSLNLNLSQPSPIAQIAQWLAQHPIPKSYAPLPSFQILGVEQLTRQPGSAQRQFLNHLQQLGQSFSSLEHTLLIWLTRPWFHSLQQSAPAFWNCHTALFEFEGDPTPTSQPTIVPAFAPHHYPAASQRQASRQHRTSPGDLDRPPAPSAEAAASSPAQPQAQDKRMGEPQGLHQAPQAPQAPVVASSDREDPSSESETGVENAQILEILNHDLALLNGEAASCTPDQDRRLAPEEPTQDHASQAATLAESSPETADPVPVEVSVELAEELPAPATTQTSHSRFLPSLLSESHPEADLAQLIRASLAQYGDRPPSAEATDILQALQQIEHLHQQQASHTALATAYQILGNLYRDRIEQGDNAEQTLMIAIGAYERTLAWLDDASPLWPDLLNDIGNLYWMLSRQAAGSELTVPYLEQGITAYQLALSQVDAEARPQTYAMIQNNLGSAYGDLSRYRDAASTLQSSVQAYEAALRYRNPDEDPARYAATQNNLGTAYWNLAQHQQPVSNLRRAIDAYTEALRFYSQERDPLHHAMIQNNLGTAYWSLAQYESNRGNSTSSESAASALLLQAVDAYHAALVYRTLETVPTSHAATQNNLGTAYWNLATLSGIAPEERNHYLQQAVAAYHASLEAVQYLSTVAAGSAAPISFDVFATHNNLGLAYHQLAIDKQGPSLGAKLSQYLEASLYHHLEALQGWSQHPDFYQTALGHIVQTIRSFHSECGLKGQNLALSKVPANLLPELMKRL